jgi:hypothetical protein
VLACRFEVRLTRGAGKTRCEYLPKKEDEGIMLDARDTILVRIVRGIAVKLIQGIGKGHRGHRRGRQGILRLPLLRDSPCGEAVSSKHIDAN